MFTLAMIAAVGKNLELGAKNELLWHLPIDFKWFIRQTKFKPIIMGSNTMLSLAQPLKNRSNYVVTSKDAVLDGFIKCNSLDEALNLASNEINMKVKLNTWNEDVKKEIMIIGGAKIYEQCLPICNKLYLTKVYAEFPAADVFFPKYLEVEWQLIFSEKHFEDKEHQYDFEFLIYEKK